MGKWAKKPAPNWDGTGWDGKEILPQLDSQNEYSEHLGLICAAAPNKRGHTVGKRIS